MNKKHLVALTTLPILASTFAFAIATPIIQEIKAQYNAGIEYELNGEKVMNGLGGLVYEDKVYVPLRSVAETLGVEVNYADGKVSMVQANQKDEVPTTPVEETIEVMTTEGTIKTIAEDLSYIVIVDKNNQELRLNLNVSEEGTPTTVKDAKDKAIYKASDLKVDMAVSVEHSTATTYSLPPQSAAYEITILNKEEAPEVETMQTSGKIVDVAEDFSTATLVNDKDQEIILILSEDTEVAHKMNKRLYQVQDLEKGLEVTVTHNMVQTLSNPPQIGAIQITINN